jgi:flagellar hook protein FlgE
MDLRAMNAGVSGLLAEQKALSVVGDNIANVNTVGYKAERAIFEDVLGHSILAGTSSGLPGSGVAIGAIKQIYTQGSINTTGISTDVALSGDGFFVVSGAVDGIVGNFYTRAGQFTLDKDGYLVNPNGLKVQGYAANGDGTFSASLSSIQAPTSSIQPRATTGATITANLDATALPPTEPWTNTAVSFADRANASTTQTVYDSLGNSHTMDLYFVNTGTGTWDWHAVMDGTDLTATGGTGSLTFGTNGALTGVGTNSDVTFNPTGADPMTVTLDFGTPSAAGAAPVPGATTGFASASNVSAQSQDGYASGDFSGISIDGQGVVMGLYTNGQKLAISQMGVAKFRSNDGLGRAGESLWIDTRESGPAAMGTAASGGRGSVSAGAVESSNVDLATEFVELIQHQRSFSANSKTITTADEMLQELINIKR